jgi:hypothetical protein
VGCEKWRHLVQKYKWEKNIAMAVMQAESGCIENRIGDDYPINGLHRASCGLFQVRTLDGRPTCKQLQSASTNVEWAYKIYTAAKNRGQNPWTPWSVYNNGQYRKFLK